MCTLGPSRPSASADRERATDELHRNDAKRRLRQLLIEHNLDVRDAAADRLRRRCHERATPQSRSRPQAATNSQTPSGPWACAKATSASRSDPPVRAKHETGDPSPEIAPTTSARTVRSADPAVAFWFAFVFQFRNHSRLVSTARWLKMSRSETASSMRRRAVVSSPAVLGFIRNLIFEPIPDRACSRRRHRDGSETNAICCG
jgi:hypothetical protein